MKPQNQKPKTKQGRPKYSSSSSNLNQHQDLIKNYSTLTLLQNKVKISLNKRPSFHKRDHFKVQKKQQTNARANTKMINMEIINKEKVNFCKQQNPKFNFQNFIQNMKTKSIHKTSEKNTERNVFTSNQKKTGRLILGKNTEPKLILNKQARLNPFGTVSPVITENLIQNKGIFNLVSLGALPKNYDYVQLLNNKYELIDLNHHNNQQKLQQYSNEPDTFLTNPIMMNQYQKLKKDSQIDIIQKSICYKSNQKIILIEDNQVKNKQEKNKIRKSKAKKIKAFTNQRKAFTNQRIIKDQIAQIFKIQVPILQIKNFFIQKSDNYYNYFKDCLKNGNQIEFNYGIKKIQQFCAKYNLKKVRFKPKFNLMLKNINQKTILSLILDHKIIGIDKCIMKKNNNILRGIILRAIAMLKFKTMKANIKKIDHLKKYFRIRKIFYQTIQRRYNFAKYKLGSFAQEQRRFLQSFQQKQNLYSLESNSQIDFNKSNPILKNTSKIQIHILTLNYDLTEQQTYYKLSQRLKIQLTRLFSSDPQHLILIMDQKYGYNLQIELAIFFKMIKNQQIKNQKVSSKKTELHIFETNFPEQFNISQSGCLYFGLSPKIINQVKNICNGIRPIVIPYKCSKYLPQICQSLQANLYGGTYTAQSLNIVFGEQQQNMTYQSQTNEINPLKFKRQMFAHKRKKLDAITIANYCFQQKTKVIQFFSQNNVLTPFRVSCKNIQKQQFFILFSQIILTKKQINKWVLKLSKSNFSRGLAFFSTLQLKVVQQSKKKMFITSQDIRRLAQLLPVIFVDKITLSHPSLWEKYEFLDQFFKGQGYIQQFLQNCESCCLFGKITPSGYFQFLGTYKKIETNNYVCCGALYPAQQIKQKVLQNIKQLSISLFKQNVFGYITFEMLFQKTSSKVYFIDLIPNLQEYSSLHFMYNNMFKSQQIYSQYFSFNTLPKYILYCPFIDNNGNKFQTIQDFIDECVRQKVWYNPISQEGQKYIFLRNDPTALSLISFGNSLFQTIKYSIDALSFLIQNGGKFNQFDFKQKTKSNSNFDEGLRKTDGLYIMDILWKLRQLKKKEDSKMKLNIKI